MLFCSTICICIVVVNNNALLPYRMTMAVERPYTPTSNELNEAIEKILHSDEAASSRTVRLQLVKEHKHWKVPERRVSKFVKRQKRQAAGPMYEGDDNASVISSVSRRARGVAKGMGKRLHIGRFKKPKAVDMESPLENVTITTTAPPGVPSFLGAMAQEQVDVTELHDEDPLDSMSKGESKMATASEVETSAKARDLAYVDDNDGKKNGAFCQPCEGCLIL